MKRCLVNSSVFISAVIFSLLLSEGILRLLFEPVDYLMPYLIADDTLGHKVAPNSGGHDAWGFRNRSVPDKADIVTIGDSQTYGVAASRSQSWPAMIEKVTNKTVYNLALGGYGPVQYGYLLENKAVLLKPATIIVGFYFGNDLKDAYRNDRWTRLHDPKFKPETPAESDSDTPIMFESLRDYFAHHSILYRSAMLSFGEVFRFLELKYANSDATVMVFDQPKLGIRSGFMPGTMFNAQRLDDPDLKEGLQISLDRFLEMSRFCAARGIHFYVVLIPTKENVFAEFIGDDDAPANIRDAVRHLVENEKEINQLAKQFFNDHQIVYIDVLKPLRNAVGKQTIYPTNQDSHPNKNGYEIIARTVAANLQ